MTIQKKEVEKTGYTDIDRTEQYSTLKLNSPNKKYKRTI